MGYLKLHASEDQRKRRLKKGFVDICLAVAYSEELRNTSSIQEVRELLPKSRLRMMILTHVRKRFELDDIMPGNLIVVLDKHRIYQEVVGIEIVKEIAEELFMERLTETLPKIELRWTLFFQSWLTEKKSKPIS